MRANRIQYLIGIRHRWVPAGMAGPPSRMSARRILKTSLGHGERRMRVGRMRVGKNQRGPIAVDHHFGRLHRLDDIAGNRIADLERSASPAVIQLSGKGRAGRVHQIIKTAARPVEPRCEYLGRCNLQLKPFAVRIRNQSGHLDGGHRRVPGDRGVHLGIF